MSATFTVTITQTNLNGSVSATQPAFSCLENRKDFPIHFEFVQPLRFAEYNLETKEFDVWKPYKIKGVRRFEVLAEDLYKDVCDWKSKKQIPGYPKGLLVELNRPFSLDTIEVEPDVCQRVH